MEEKDFNKKTEEGKIEEVKEKEEKPETPESPEDILRTSLEDYVDILENLRHNGIPGFVDRGDPAANDFTIANFTRDETWRDLDLSAIVPTGAKAVALQVKIQHDLANESFGLRKNGNSNEYNTSWVRTQVAGQTIYAMLPVACDTDRVIEYFATAPTGADDFTAINVTVMGWWM